MASTPSNVLGATLIQFFFNENLAQDEDSERPFYATSCKGFNCSLYQHSLEFMCLGLSVNIMNGERVEKKKAEKKIGWRSHPPKE